MRSVLARVLTVIGITTALGAPAGAATGYTETKLVSDLSLPGVTQDANLKSPWGLAYGPTSPFWAADESAGYATVYTGAGVVQALVVTVPPLSGGSAPSHPTGVAFNGTSDFGGKSFLFATEEGVIAGWAGSDGTTAIREVDNNASGAVYKGLAIGSTGGSRYLYATNFNAGTIDVFDDTFAPAALSGSFTDPNLPAGFAPFGIENIGGVLYVTYAKQDGSAFDDVPGAGNGYVDEFGTDGSLIMRLISGGNLNSPWGVALAPATFGDFANDLLVGNAGDGKINAFDPSTGAYLGTVSDPGGIPIVLPRVFGLRFGNGGSGGAAGTLFFNAREPVQGVVSDHGLFGKLDANLVNVPALDDRGRAALVLAVALVAVGLLRARRRTAAGAL
jgi:uncharacterized protein (TIGR03118 family)